MTNINLDRVEERYTVKSLNSLLDRLRELSFEKKVFSDKQMSVTYFCDTPDFSLSEKERVKIRTYTTDVPVTIDFEADYKLNFKIHKENFVSQNESFEGKFNELIDLVKDRYGREIVPAMVMAYKRSHYILPGNADIRVTVDEDITFHKVENNKLVEFYKYQVVFLEIKYDQLSESAREMARKLIASVEHEVADSKKNIMYKVYKTIFS